MILSFGTYHINAIQEKDAWNICNLMVANEDRFKRFFPQTLQQNLTPDLSKLFVKKKVKEFNKKEEYLFTIKENETNQLVGLVYIKELDNTTKQGELAYCIGYEYEGKNITTNAVKLLSEYAFKNLDLKTLQIIAHKSNIASIKVAKNCNYIWVKTLKNEFTPPEENPVDMELYELYKN
jgi:ribosomal-protein-alanine N-acetyltransferase